MCMFSRPVKRVDGTRIFARGLEGGLQGLVYAMNIDFDESVAMVLPLPVPPAPAEDAVRFVDLSGYAHFFADLRKAFPPDPIPRSKGGPLAPAALPQALKVHTVGAFDASFVPTLSDFARLDARFHLSGDVWDALPDYADHGFAVFALRPRKGWFGGGKPQSIHPMAFTFPRRDPGSLFFPTMHVHDGSLPRRAVFDHVLYAQVSADAPGWERSEVPLREILSSSVADGLVDGRSYAWRRRLGGLLPNADTWLRDA